MALQGYTLPQNRYIEQQAAVAPAPPIAGPELGLPALNDAYANVQGVTDEFINTVGQIKAYAHDMAKTYGIDVTKPDYSQPGGGQPYRTFQELTAKSIMTGNDLKESMRRNTLDEAAQRAGTFIGSPEFDPTEQMSSQIDISQRGTPTALLPEVKQASDALMRVYDSKSAAERATLAFKKPLVDKLQALIQADPQNAAFYQRQIDALPDAIYQPHIFVPSSGDAGRTEKRQAIVDLYKRTTNLIKGAWEEGSYETTLDENFNPIFKNTELSGMSLGSKDFVVKKQKKTYPLILESITSKDGKMYMNFVQPEEAQKDNFEIPSEEITGTKGDLFLKRAIEKGKGLGVNTTELVTALKEAGLYTETGSKDDEVVRKDLILKAPPKENIKKAVDSLKTIMSLSKGGEVLNTTLPNGQQIQVTKKSNLLGTKFEITIDGTSSTGNMDDAIRLLREFGYFNQYLQAPEEAAAQPSAPQLERLPNETEGAYQLRLLRAKQAKK